MSIKKLDLAEPFFKVKYLLNEQEYAIGEKTILINLSDKPIKVQNQEIGFFRSVVVTNTKIYQIDRGLLIEDFASYANEEALLQDVKKVWPLAYDVRKEERLKGVSHYMSPKANLGNIVLSMYHSGSVPLKVGLHQTHPHGGGTLKEVHTQIVGFGKMQQCLEKDINTLYLEEAMAPGTTHHPMFDEQGNYPWHQYETITPGIFMAIEMQMSDELGVE
ncbi:MAG: hypothetical protein HOD92_13635 [Deltaproteobacteria bacterium]|jgi:hypothetical protein|nr:hypothetical protein [Deltaproteobacteria bacterium]MBT4526590.1 hypothetical protein [Deltaproteobacteria bacterium]